MYVYVVSAEIIMRMDMYTFNKNQPYLNDVELHIRLLSEEIYCGIVCGIALVYFYFFIFIYLMRHTR